MTGKDTTRYGHPCRTIFLPEQVNCYLHTKHVLCHTSRRSGPCKRLHEAWTSRPADILQETRKGSTTQCKYTTTDSPRKKKPHKKFSLTFTAEQEILSYEVRKSPIRTPASHFRDSNKWNCSIMPRQRYALACCSPVYLLIVVAGDGRMYHTTVVVTVLYCTKTIVLDEMDG